MLRVPIILYHGGNNINWGMAKRFNAPDFDSGIFAGPNPATSAILFILYLFYVLWECGGTGIHMCLKGF